MPKDPNGRLRPADIASNAIKAMRVATGEDDDTVPNDGNDDASVSLGRRGGNVKAEALSPKSEERLRKKRPKLVWNQPSNIFLNIFP